MLAVVIELILPSAVTVGVHLDFFARYSAFDAIARNEGVFDAVELALRGFCGGFKHSIRHPDGGRDGLVVGLELLAPERP